MYRKNLFCLFFALSNYSNLVLANSIETDLQGFVPKGWKILGKAEGDLNGDQQPDLALIIENTDPKNIVHHDSYDKNSENQRLNLNERKLLVLFKDDQTYHQIASNDSLPRENSNEKKCLIDPLIVDHSPIIQNGLLKISLNFGFRCESWEVFNNLYSFRYQNQAFYLIGYDLHYFDRPSGNSRSESTDFLTRKFKQSLSTPELDLKRSPQISRSKLNKTPLLKLEQINFALYVHR
ncbi:hypothetical protein [Acinetobacter bereziniae]|uniref:hypothetical protein n=1 Tax=Acinetobacter bereziniae TaxID=106648 RepID=UPI001250371C|nr:hypothetical protein [Acinetobacter bereziniae]MCU4317315.1 hypothetical protein [Acinetobacter bereziniae]